MIKLERTKMSPIKDPLTMEFEDFRKAVLTAIEQLKEPADEFTITVDLKDKNIRQYLKRKNYWAEGIKTCNWDKYVHRVKFDKPLIRQREKGSNLYMVMCYGGELCLRMPWIGVHPNQEEVRELCDYYNKTHGGK